MIYRTRFLFAVLAASIFALTPGFAQKAILKAKYDVSELQKEIEWLPTNTVFKVQYSFSSEIKAKDKDKRFYKAILCSPAGDVVPVEFPEAGFDYMKRHFLSWTSWESDHQVRMQQRALYGQEREGLQFHTFFIYAMVTTQRTETVRGDLPVLRLLGIESYRSPSGPAKYSW